METVQNEVRLCCLEHCHDVIDEIIKDLRIEACAFDVKLILSEAIMNAHCHGNQKDCTKPIYIRYKLKDKHLNIQVKDCGNGTEKFSIPEEIDNDDLLDDGGRGLFLIRCLSDHVEMIHNTIHIDKTLTDL